MISTLYFSISRNSSISVSWAKLSYIAANVVYSKIESHFVDDVSHQRELGFTKDQVSKTWQWTVFKVSCYNSHQQCKWLRTSIPQFSIIIQPLLDALERAYSIAGKRRKRALHCVSLGKCVGANRNQCIQYIQVSIVQPYSTGRSRPQKTFVFLCGRLRHSLGRNHGLDSDGRHTPTASREGMNPFHFSQADLSIHSRVGQLLRKRPAASWTPSGEGNG